MISNHEWAMITVGVAFAVVVGWIGFSETDDQVVPDVQTEMQFTGLGLDTGMRVNLGTNGAIDPDLHFWHPGYDPEPGGQPIITSRVRYPYVSGGNISTLIHKGFDAMCRGSAQDNSFRVNPPSEAEL
jgi:hypothetical protein